MSVAQERATGPAALQRRGRFRPGDAILYVVTCAAALTGVVLLALITDKVLTEAWPAMQKFGVGFLTTQAWGDKGNTLFGAKSFIFGTVVTSLGALLLATPISLAIALFLSELAPRWIRSVVAPLVELLAAIPSVVLGLWGILVLGPFITGTLGPAIHGTLGWVPIFSTKPTVGSNMFAAILILTIMIIPIVSSICREIFVGVPARAEGRRARSRGDALGGRTWRRSSRTPGPGSRRRSSLGSAERLGEAIAVTQVIGNRVAINTSLFDPGDTLASRIAGQYQGADTALQVASLVYLAVILLVFSLIANLAAQLIVRRVAGRHQV